MNVAYSPWIDSLPFYIVKQKAKRLRIFQVLRTLTQLKSFVEIFLFRNILSPQKFLQLE